MIKLENGVYQISNEQYHANAGISRSALMEFSKSPYHYWYKYLSGKAEREESTPDMNIGSAVHTLVLEPDFFDEEFFICSQKSRPNRGTPPHEKMLLEANGRIVLTADELARCQSMAESLRANKDACALLAGCKIEESIYFEHKPTGLQCKSRPDAWAGNIVIDLKTSADASLRPFQNSAITYGYFLQAAFAYRALESINIAMESFAFIIVEKKAPYSVAIYEMDKEALEYGLNQFDRLMESYARCLESNNWPGYQIRKVCLPGWVKFDDEGV